MADFMLRPAQRALVSRGDGKSMELMNPTGSLFQMNESGGLRPSGGHH